LTAEVTDLENDSFISHAQVILVVILMPENIRKNTDKRLCCVHFLYNLSPRFTHVQWFGNRRRRHRRRYRVYNNKYTSVDDILFTISLNNSSRIDTAHFLLQVSPTNFLLP